MGHDKKTVKTHIGLLKRTLRQDCAGIYEESWDLHKHGVTGVHMKVDTIKGGVFFPYGRKIIFKIEVLKVNFVPVSMIVMELVGDSPNITYKFLFYSVSTSSIQTTLEIKFTKMLRQYLIKKFDFITARNSEWVTIGGAKAL